IPDEREATLLAALPRVTKFAALLLGSWSDAPDVANEVLLLAMYGGKRGGQKWDGKRELWPFVRGLTKTFVKTRRRSVVRGTVDQPLVSNAVRDDDGADYDRNDEPAASVSPADSKRADRLMERVDDEAARDARRAALEAESKGDDGALRVLALFDQDISG